MLNAVAAFAERDSSARGLEADAADELGLELIEASAGDSSVAESLPNGVTVEPPDVVAFV